MSAGTAVIANGAMWVGLVIGFPFLTHMLEEHHPRLLLTLTLGILSVAVAITTLFVVAI